MSGKLGWFIYFLTGVFVGQLEHYSKDAKPAKLFWINFTETLEGEVDIALWRMVMLLVKCERFLVLFFGEWRRLVKAGEPKPNCLWRINSEVNKGNKWVTIYYSSSIIPDSSSKPIVKHRKKTIKSGGPPLISFRTMPKISLGVANKIEKPKYWFSASLNEWPGNPLRRETNASMVTSRISSVDTALCVCFLSPIEIKQQFKGTATHGELRSRS